MDQAGDRSIGEKPQQTTDAEHKGDGGQKEKRRGRKQSLFQRWAASSLTNKVLSVCGILSALGVIAYAVLTFYLLQATREAADAAAASAQAAQDAVHESSRQFNTLQKGRASLKAEKFRASGPVELTETCNAAFCGGSLLPTRITVKNIGKSSAMVTIAGIVAIMEFDETVSAAGYAALHPACNTVIRGSEVSRSVEPGESSEFVVDTGEKISPLQLELFEVDRFRIVFVGCIKSRDKFGENERIYICADLNPLIFNTLKIQPNRHPADEAWWQPCADNNWEIK